MSRTGRNLSFLAASQLITWALTLIWTVFVPRRLGPQGTGLLVAAWSATSILSLLVGLGTNNVLVREIAIDRRRGPALLGTAVLVRLLLAPLCVVAVILYGRLGDFDAHALLILYLATAAVLVQLITELLQACFQALERMEYIAFTDVGTRFFTSLGGVVLVLLGFGATAIMGWALLGAGVGLLGAGVWLRGQFRVDWTLSAARVRELVRKSLSYWTFGLFFTIYTYIDAVILSLLTTSTVVGWYGVPVRLYGSLMFAPVALSRVWLPRLAVAYEAGEAELFRAARVPVEQVLLLSLPACVGAALVAGPVIRLLYGNEFQQSVPVFVLLAYAAAPTWLNIVVSQIFIASNRQGVWTRLMAGATIVNPVLNVVLIPYYQGRNGNGAIGAALSLLLTELLIAAAGIVLARRVLAASSFARLARAALATAGMAALVSLAAPLGVFVQVPLGVAAFAALALVLRLPTPEELRQLTGVARRLTGRRQPVAASEPAA